MLFDLEDQDLNLSMVKKEDNKQMLSISTMLKEDHFNQDNFNENEIFVQKEDAI